LIISHTLRGVAGMSICRAPFLWWSASTMALITAGGARLTRAFDAERI
jgi:hypothetical protein